MANIACSCTRAGVCHLIPMKNLLPLLTLACLLSCQTNGDQPKPYETILAENAPEIDVTKTETMIGQPLEKVQAACDAAEVRHRVIEVDGEPRMGTKDYRPDRLNFKVKAGLVTEVTKG
jgi:hypothetical protein